MSPSEFFFLAAGLMLGIGVGAALVEVLRARPAARREVRVTVAAAAIPARAATLATILPDWSVPVLDNEPRPERMFGAASSRADPCPTPDDRVPIPIVGEREPALALAGAGGGPGNGPGSGPRSGSTPAERIGPGGSPVAAGRADPVAPRPAGPGAAAARPDADPCATLRATAEERCTHAERMAAVAAAAAERHREARRAYDEATGRRDRAAATMDPRAVRATKDEAQATFRRARLAAPDRDALEAAAREWLREIDRINHRTREAAAVVAREDAAAPELLRTLERLGVAADGARITAENAAEACVQARTAFADCEEAERVGAAVAAPEAAPEAAPAFGTPPPAPTIGKLAATTPAAVAGSPGDDAGGPAKAAVVRGEATILRLLRGDRQALRQLVSRLGGDDPDAQRRWQLQLTDLVDAILVRAIDDAALTFPEDHVFWGPYTRAQCRDIAAALASLGYRFDGLGGFADGRVPSQRDLSLAVGYAGQDPMRVRIWPTEAELPALFRDVKVDAGRFLADAAGGLTLGEMVDLLGRRAEGLSELWNAWGRVRPLLLEGD